MRPPQLCRHVGIDLQVGEGWEAPPLSPAWCTSCHRSNGIPMSELVVCAHQCLIIWGGWGRRPLPFPLQQRRCHHRIVPAVLVPLPVTHNRSRRVLLCALPRVLPALRFPRGEVQVHEVYTSFFFVVLWLLAEGEVGCKSGRNVTANPPFLFVVVVKMTQR